MKKIMSLLMGLVISLSLTSCITAQASEDLYSEEMDARVIIALGTPVFVDDMIAYYVYNGWYYYPYWVGDRYCLHKHRRPLSPRHFGSWYKPIPKNHHYRPIPNTYRPPRHDRFSSHRQTPPPEGRRTPNNNIGNRPHHNNNMGGGHSGRGHFAGRR